MPRLIASFDPSNPTSGTINVGAANPHSKIIVQNSSLSLLNLSVGNQGNYLILPFTADIVPIVDPVPSITWTTQVSLSVTGSPISQVNVILYGQTEDILGTYPLSLPYITNVKLTKGLGQMVNVLDYAGVDPTGNSDSYTALQSIFNSGGSIYFPPGTYRTSQQLTITLDYTELHGELNSVIKATDITTIEYVLYASQRTGILIDTLTIDANYQGRVGTGPGPWGINNRLVACALSLCVDSTVRNSSFINSMGQASPPNASAGGGIALLLSGTRCKAYGCTIQNAGTLARPSDGIYCSGSQMLLENNICNVATDTAFVIENSQQSGIVNCTALNCSSIGAISAVSGALLQNPGDARGSCSGNYVNGLTGFNYNGGSTGGFVVAAYGNSDLINTSVSNLIISRDGAIGTGPAIQVYKGASAGAAVEINGLTFNGVVIDGNVQGAGTGGTQGLLITNGKNIEIANARIINTRSAALQVGTGNSNIHVVGGYFTSIAAACISVIDGTNVVLEDVITDAAKEGAISPPPSYGVYFYGTGSGCQVIDAVIRSGSVGSIGSDAGTNPVVVSIDKRNVQGGINFGKAGSANLYLTNAGQLTTDTTLYSGGGFIHRSGTTAARPTGGTVVAGMEYFDTTLNKPIWRNTANTGWIDATGTAV